MDQKYTLNIKERLVMSLMLFGLFFGAGNIIFPIFLGQNAGTEVLPAISGFNITAVGLPLLAIAAIGISESESVLDLASRVSKPFGYFFTVALYLTIGPFFATPRLATVSYEVALSGVTGGSSLALVVYSLIFFSLALWFALRPSQIIESVGRFLTPTFLALLMIILVRSWFGEGPSLDLALPAPNYANTPVTTGLLQGYHTMDSLAGLAFGIVIIRSIRSFGIRDPRRITREVLISGSVGIILMALIYLALAYLGYRSLAFLPVAANGGQALAQITDHYFGGIGILLLSAMMMTACLKTAIGLIVALAETFDQLSPHWITQRRWSVFAAVLAGLVANIGFEAITQLSLPVLMLLYPLAFVLILIALLPRHLQSRTLYRGAIWVTIIPAALDFIKAAPPFISRSAWGLSLIDWADESLPFFELGFGWLIPALTAILVILVGQTLLKRRSY